MTLFEVRRHKDVIERLLQGIQPDHHVKDNEEEGFEDEPNAQRVETYSRDFVEGILRGMEPVQFENLIAAVLRAMGYHAEVTQLSGDGGVDVLASHDPLRLQPPTIKVQVKRTTSSIGGPAVQALLGTLAPGGSELALFVTLGNYSNDATHIARTRQDIRLLSGAQLIDLVFEYYNKLDSEWQRLLPLRLVYAVDRDL
jgi:restriction system protein